MIGIRVLLTALLLQANPDAGYYAAMRHRHLVLAYVLTWVAQLGYLAWVLLRWRRSR